MIFIFGFTFTANIRRAVDGLIYIDMGTMDEATKTVHRYNGQQLGENAITITAITRQQMQLGVEKKVEAVCFHIFSIFEVDSIGTGLQTYQELKSAYLPSSSKED